MDNDQDKSLGPAMALQESEGGGAELGEIYATLMEARWMIFVIVIGFVLLGFAFSLIKRPEFRADGLLQVEEKASSALSGLKELGSLMGLAGDTTVAAEQEILYSRMILEKVIERQRLNIVAEPRYFPIIGRAIARRYNEDGIANSFLGLSGYAWGGEAIQVDSLTVPPDMQDQKLRLFVLNDGRFDIYSDDAEVVLKGRVGERAVAGKYSVFVSKLIARPGQEFNLVRLSQAEAIKALGGQYSIKERGKKSGVLELGLVGYDREKVGIVLDDIMNTYVRQNVERRSAEAENTLKFLEKQIPDIKQQMVAAEDAYNSYRKTRGSLDLSAETQSVLQSIVEVDNQIVALMQEKSELRQYFTVEHPRIQAVDARLDKLKHRRAEFEGQIAKLPSTQQEVLRLARDVEVSTALYTDLINTSQQLKVSKAGTIGDVRIIDSAAVSSQPIGMKPLAFSAIGGVLGLIVSLCAVWIRYSFNVVVQDPDEIETKIGLPVYVSIPFSRSEAEISRRSKGVGAGELLAVSVPEDDAVESLRSLRTTLHFALLDSKRSSLLITGASPAAGKSFVSKNLGALLAQSGKRIAIVDADLRRGHLSKDFGLRREIGISEYIASEVSLDEIVKPTTVPNLWVVTTGQIPPNPSELLMHVRFEQLLGELADRFDTLILDAPPILAVSDAAIIGRHVGATLLVARAGLHPIRELEQAIKRLSQAGVPVKGFVFNGMDVNSQRYRYGYKGYVYKYSYAKGT